MARDAGKQTNESPKRRRGGQLGNQNAKGHGAPKGNRNAAGHGAPRNNKNALKTGEYERIGVVRPDGRVHVSYGPKGFKIFYIDPEDALRHPSLVPWLPHERR